MKAKETAKKLNVSKVTVANLDSKSMSRLLGGSTGDPGGGSDQTVAPGCKYITEAC